MAMKIRYEPFKEIVVKDLVKFENLNDLLYGFANMRAAGQPVALSWAEGVVFVYVGLSPNTPGLMKDFLKGRLYYVGVNFALLENYAPSLVYKNQQGQVAVPIINVSSSQMLCEVAKWLKTQ